MAEEASAICEAGLTMIEDGLISEMALALRQAGKEPAVLSPIADVATAYAIQNANTAEGLAAGRRIVGVKVGLTTAAAQTAFYAREPTVGVLFGDMECPDASLVLSHRLRQPQAEGEIAFVLARDLIEPEPSLAEVIAAVDFLLPAIEIVDHRQDSWTMPLTNVIADNACAGLYVLGGSPRRLGDVDLWLCGMVLEINGEPASTGAGLASLGNPLNALRWVAGHLARTGRPLRAGNVILSGALGPMSPIRSGDVVSLRIAGLGSCSFILGEDRP
ncbi:2-keto-4-pentenoate hydratase [Devosia salina]|uniref:Fumarylacetoacetate hydrolase family protein n=1 Tax=Devosia salina TaxID=2860336 RepID=A0ABX8WB19_9HYPH|nr:fumarylacetoacetate hydrolase family protein [Devosia salina]QYO75633.1 fumarylacetoacetate hydrolase family protein [Devosia salina]